MGNAAGAPAARAAVIGHPIAHSKSPLLHAAAYDALGVDCDYTARDVGPEDLARFVSALRSEDGWRGLSVTMPHKAAVAAATDSNSELVETLGVLNTVTFSGGPGAVRLTGHNTDVAGVAGALRHAGAGVPRNGVILGGGGTAAAAVAGLRDLGARSARVYVRRDGAAEDLERIGSRLGIHVTGHPWDGAVEGIRAADVVISTLPPHAADPLARSLAVSLGAAPADRVAGAPPRLLLDVAYDPWPSELATAWSRAGGLTVPGLEMLLYQAVEQVLLFFPEVPALDEGVINRMCDAVGAPRR